MKNTLAGPGEHLNKELSATVDISGQFLHYKRKPESIFSISIHAPSLADVGWGLLLEVSARMKAEAEAEAEGMALGPWRTCVHSEMLAIGRDLVSSHFLPSP